MAELPRRLAPSRGTDPSIRSGAEGIEDGEHVRRRDHDARRTRESIAVDDVRLMSRRSIALTGDGSYVVVRSPEGLHVAPLVSAGGAVLLPAVVGDFAVVGSELWLVDVAERATLRRFTFRGKPVGRPQDVHPSTPEGRLITAASATCAAWTGSPARLVDADCDTASRTIPGEPEFTLPISSSRWLTCARGQVILRESALERWRSDAIVGRGRCAIDGAILFDATFAALVTAAGAAADGELVHQVVVFGLRDPIIQHRFTLTGAEAIRFARGRGIALALIARRRLVVLDLRFGSLIAEHETDHDVLDIAIDDTGQRIALRNGERLEDVMLVSLRELLAATSSATRRHREDALVSDVAAAPVEDDEPTDASVDAGPPSTAAEPPRAAIHLDAVVALAPRVCAPAISQEELLEVLSAYRELTGALAEHAIARAWDEERLAAPDPQQPPFRAQVRGIRGRSVGHAREDLIEAAEGVGAAVLRLSDLEARHAGRLSPLGRLVAELHLSPTAARLLLVASAPMLWGELAPLYAILTNDVARPLCDEQLVRQLLALQSTPYEIARELGADAPLIRHGLVRFGGGRRPFAAINVDPVVLHLLCGGDTSLAIRDVRVVEASVRFEDLLVAPDVKARIATAVAIAPSGPPRVVVRGRIGSGRHTLLATLAAASGRRLGVIDAGPLVRDVSAREHELELAMRRAHLLGLLPCIDGLETIAPDDPAARDRVRAILREHPGPLAIRLPHDAQAPIDPGYVAIDLPALSIGERLSAWESSLGAHGLDVRAPLELATRYGAGPGAISRACRAVAHERAATSAPAGEVTSHIEAALRQHIEARLGTAATRVERLATWSQVVLPGELQDSLTELIARFKHRRTVYEAWQYDRVVTTSRGVVALFEGGPGTGKTMVAGAIANELGVDLYRVDLSRIVSKWIGETEQNLARLFDAAEDAHAIILFDEADSLFAKRTKVQSSVDRYANLEVNYLLQRLDSFEGIAILTTNFGSAIDRAFSRRLTLRATFPFPDDEARERLWRAHLPDAVPRAGKLDLGALARRFKLSGGYIRNAAVRAAFLAAEEHAPLTQEHLERAIRAEFRELGQLSDSSALE
ncbi:MAG: ATP-binding protein [Deltaproteobacteria bacterium]|nr:ATP-binding protein [Deltaproteobacteria bacterium]